MAGNNRRSCAFSLTARLLPSVVLLLVLVTAGCSEDAAEAFLRDSGSAEVLSTECIERGFAVLEGELSDRALAKARLPKILRLAVLLMKNDPSDYAAELVYPIYVAYQNEAQMEISRWTKSDRDLFLQQMRDYARMLKEGNG